MPLYAAICRSLERKSLIFLGLGFLCIKDRGRKDALFKLHIQSGLVDIPKDPTVIVHLEDGNHELEPYDIEGTGYDLEDVDYGWVKD